VQSCQTAAVLQAALTERWANMLTPLGWGGTLNNAAWCAPLGSALSSPSSGNKAPMHRVILRDIRNTSLRVLPGRLPCSHYAVNAHMQVSLLTFGSSSITCFKQLSKQKCWCC
jgi:hypothetical protein